MIRPSKSGLLSKSALPFVLMMLAALSVGAQHVYAQTTDREKILNSAPWKKAMEDLQQWSSVQQIYDKDQLAAKKQELDKKIAAMSAPELSSFLTELQQKLVILHSDEARNARKWLDETMAVAAPAYAKKLRSQFPDIVEITPEQMQSQLDAYQSRIQETQEASVESAKLRETQVKQIREQRVRDENARLASEIASESAPRSNYNFSTRIRNYDSSMPASPLYPMLYGGYRW